MASVSIALKNDRRELLRLAALVERFSADHHLPDDFVTNVNLVLDEVVSNVIKYGNAPADGVVVDVTLTLVDQRLTIQVSDRGIAFNPLDAKPPDLDLPIMDRPVGGLGIHIVRTLAEDLSYRREDDRNHLSLTMRVGA